MSYRRTIPLVLLVAVLAGPALSETAPADASQRQWEAQQDALAAVPQPADVIRMPNWVRDVTRDRTYPADGVIKTPRAALDIAWVIVSSQPPGRQTTLPGWRAFYTAELKGDVWIVHERHVPKGVLGAGLFCFISRKDGRLLGEYVDQ